MTPIPDVMQHIPNGGDVLSWVSTATAIVTAALYLRLRLAKTNTDIIKHGAEGNWVGHIIQERNEAVAGRIADAAAIAGLQAREIAAREELTRVKAELALVKRLLMRLDPDAARFFQTEDEAASHQIGVKP